ncbi:enoyl-CoA hydratase-related protein [Amycolatopsis sp. NPDC023774]|uniref:enoyl-CoA hydratase-related protein n=1 Tax=Amycolatopsis sp. NPDC023774 TaxID=3155015 RepID=UPI0033CB846F
MITSEVRDDVGIVAIDRHERRNALDVEHLDDLRKAVEDVGPRVRALVITGRGTSFCAGADLRGVHGDGFRTALYAALHSITTLPIPVLAAVNGPAIGAGTQLAIACDLRVAAPAAVFAVPTARNGLVVDPWTVRRLALLAGGGASRAMLLGCDRLDASLAHVRGLVDRLGDFDAALEWAREIAGFSASSVRYSKLALDTLFEGPWEATLDTEFEDSWPKEVPT